LEQIKVSATNAADGSTVKKCQTVIRLVELVLRLNLEAPSRNLIKARDHQTSKLSEVIAAAVEALAPGPQLDLDIIQTVQAMLR
ncbi:MAG: hypothetical protein LBH76_07190, partial [Propionibacteriaceae bacterium]|nr:hypothetical protein [Propionibacteriaceae bacterium]